MAMVAVIDCAFGLLLLDLPVDGCELCQLLDGLGFHRRPRPRHVRSPMRPAGMTRSRGDRSGIETVAQRRKAGDIELARNQILRDMLALGLGHRAVEFDQNLAGRDLVAVLHMDRRYDSGLQRLNGLGAPGRNDLAGCRRDDVDMAENRPCDREHEKQDDRRADRPAGRRRRRLEDLQRRGQELARGIVPAPARLADLRCRYPLATPQLTTWKPACIW